MNRPSILASAALLLAVPAFGQENAQPAPTTRKTAAAADGPILDDAAKAKLARAIETVSPAGQTVNVLDDTARRIKGRLGTIDRNALSDASTRLRELENEETRLQAMRERAARGESIDVDSAFPRSAAEHRVDESLIGLEEQELLRLRAELARTELDAKKREADAKKRRDRDRDRPSVTGNALLGTLDEIPPAPAGAVKATAAVAKAGPDAGRLARALYGAEDWVGALANFRAMKAEEVTLGDRYATARCLEETGDLAGALAELEKIVGESKEGFWHDRALALQKYLKSERGIRTALKK